MFPVTEDRGVVMRLKYLAMIGLCLFSAACDDSGSKGHHGSVWLYSESKDPMTDAVVPEARTEVSGDEGFSTEIDMKCFRSSGRPRFSMTASFYDRNGKPIALRQEATKNLLMNGMIATAVYRIRIGRGEPTRIETLLSDLSYSNQLPIKWLDNDYGPMGIGLLIGGLPDAAKKDFYRANQILIKPDLETGSPLFTVDFTEKAPRAVLEECRDYFGIKGDVPPGSPEEKSAGEEKVAGSGTGMNPEAGDTEAGQAPDRSDAGNSVPADANGSDTYWDHNGSRMRLHVEGATIRIFYEVPRAGMVAEGVRPQTLFFDGKRDGNKIDGAARVFSRKCGSPSTFEISGVIADGQKILLDGRRPSFVNCMATSQMRDEHLAFTYSADQNPPEAGQENRE